MLNEVNESWILGPHYSMNVIDCFMAQGGLLYRELDDNSHLALGVILETNTHTHTHTYQPTNTTAKT